MKLIQLYKTYFKNLTVKNVELKHADEVGKVAFGIENLADVLEGVFRTKIGDNQFLFLLLNPIVQPKSDANTFNAMLQGGFILLKSCPIRDMDSDDVTNALNDVGDTTLDFLIRMVDDSRNGEPLWQYGLDSIADGKVDIEEMAFMAQADGSFVGYKLIFTAEVPLLDCADFTTRLNNSKWTDK